jgi:hypothetical protein
MRRDNCLDLLYRRDIDRFRFGRGVPVLATTRALVRALLGVCDEAAEGILGEEFIEDGKRSTALVIRPACSQKLFQGIGSPKEHYPLCRYYYLATGPRIGQTHRAAVVNERQGRIVGCRTVVAKTCWHALCGDE